MPEIIDALAAHDISAERKSLYNDIGQMKMDGVMACGGAAIPSFLFLGRLFLDIVIVR